MFSNSRNDLGLPWWLSGKEYACQCRAIPVWSLIWEDSTCCRAAKPISTTIEPALWSSGAISATLQELACSRACVLQWEKPLQGEARALQLDSSPHSMELEKSIRSNEDPAQTKISTKESSKIARIQVMKLVTQVSHNQVFKLGTSIRWDSVSSPPCHAHPKSSD